MALLLLPFILMVLLEVEASYDQKHLTNNVIGDSFPPYIPAAHRVPDDSWLQIKEEQLERARLRGLNSLEDKLKTQNVGPNNIQIRDKRKTLPQNRNSPKPPRFRQCYFNPISCF